MKCVSDETKYILEYLYLVFIPKKYTYGNLIANHVKWNEKVLLRPAYIYFHDVIRWTENTPLKKIIIRYIMINIKHCADDV